MKLKGAVIASRVVALLQVGSFCASAALLLTKTKATAGVILFFAAGVLAIAFHAITGTVAEFAYFLKQDVYQSVFRESNGWFRRLLLGRNLCRRAKECGDKDAKTFLQLQWLSVGFVLFHLAVMLLILHFVHPEMLG